MKIKNCTFLFYVLFISRKAYLHLILSDSNNVYFPNFPILLYKRIMLPSLAQLHY